jgi:hypothetical protein
MVMNSAPVCQKERMVSRTKLSAGVMILADAVDNNLKTLFVVFD